MVQRKDYVLTFLVVNFGSYTGALKDGSSVCIDSLKPKGTFRGQKNHILKDQVKKLSHNVSCPFIIKRQLVIDFEM